MFRLGHVWGHVSGCGSWYVLGTFYLADVGEYVSEFALDLFQSVSRCAQTWLLTYIPDPQFVDSPQGDPYIPAVIPAHPIFEKASSMPWLLILLAQLALLYLLRTEGGMDWRDFLAEHTGATTGIPS